MTFPGTVAKVSPTASSVHAWLNPEIKVYETDVSLDETPGGLGMTPGMTATAEIIVAELKNVVYVPIDAVTTFRGNTVCLIEGQSEPTKVEPGLATEKFLEIRSGLKAGDIVYRDPGKLLGEDETDSLPRSVRVPGAAETPATSAPEAATPSPEAEPAPSAEAPPAPEGGEPEDVTGDQAADADQEGAPQYVVDGRVNWPVLGAKMREMDELDDEERTKAWQKIIDSVPEDQRAPLEETRKQRESMTPEEREQARQRRGGGGGQGGWGR